MVITERITLLLGYHGFLTLIEHFSVIDAHSGSIVCPNVQALFVLLPHHLSKHLLTKIIPKRLPCCLHWWMWQWLFKSLHFAILCPIFHALFLPLLSPNQLAVKNITSLFIRVRWDNILDLPNTEKGMFGLNEAYWSLKWRWKKMQIFYFSSCRK